jgi:catechol 2,3-dioxygenase-like lactoylglutathione lyase family enzyme
MASLQIEHVNLYVSNPVRTSDLLISLFGWSVRWHGPAQGDVGYTVHVGTSKYFLALYTEFHFAFPTGGFKKGFPLDHVCIEVDNLDEVEAKVLAAGLKPFNHANYEPGCRFYFLDQDGIEYEVVSYRRAA